MKLVMSRVLGGAVLAALALAAMTAPEDLRRTIGVSTAVISLFLLFLSRVHLGASFSVKLQARALVTRGLYAKIQHPLYCFLDLFLLGLIIYFNLPWLLIVWLFLLAIHLVEARREERFLRATFGTTYDAYQVKTWF